MNPIPMILHCPNCGLKHVDAPEPGTDWDNPPHRSHKCHGCGAVWRPADVPTTGVMEIQTFGSVDSDLPNWTDMAFEDRPKASGSGELKELRAMKARVEALPGEWSTDFDRQFVANASGREVATHRLLSLKSALKGENS